MRMVLRDELGGRLSKPRPRRLVIYALEFGDDCPRLIEMICVLAVDIIPLFFSQSI